MAYKQPKTKGKKMKEAFWLGFGQFIALSLGVMPIATIISYFFNLFA